MARREMEQAPAGLPVPADRDRYVDLVRGLSIVWVVLGHWLVTELIWRDGELGLVSALGEAPWLWPLTWVLQVIPLFFFVGGYANRRSWEGVERRGESYAAFVDRRLRRLMTPVGVLLGVVTLGGVAVALADGAGLGAGAGVLLQPLWFLGVYVVVIALTPVTLRLHRRRGWAAVLAMLGLVVVVDVLRFGVGIGAAGFVNVLLVWVTAHQLGYLYAEGSLTRARAAALAIGGFTALSAAVLIGPYPARMVGVPGDRIANMNPPTLALTALAMGQIGLTVLVRPYVLPWLQGRRLYGAVVAVNLSIMTIYLWHQPVFIAVSRLLLPLGIPQPSPPGLDWWLSRLLWLVVPGIVLGLVVLALRRFEQVPPAPPAPGGLVTATAAVEAVLCLFLGFLALAATNVTMLVNPVAVLGPVEVSPLVGLLCVGIAAVLQRALSSGARAVAQVGAASAALCLLLGVGYAKGVGLVPASFPAAVVLAGLGLLLAAAGAATATARSRGGVRA